jgi:hypothetical protein
MQCSTLQSRKRAIAENTLIRPPAVCCLLPKNYTNLLTCDVQIARGNYIVISIYSLHSQWALDNNATIKVKRVKSFPHRLINIIFKIIAHTYTHTKSNRTTQHVPTSRISSRPLPWQIAREHLIPKSHDNIQSQCTLNITNSTLKANALFISANTHEASASSLYSPNHSYTTLQVTI